jgi:carboxyl-terminal processing protease
LRQSARALEDEGTKALVLDLRGVQEAGVHPTIMLADLLLERGTIGRVRTANGVETYEAEPDALFRDWPLAVLVDGETTGAAEWLAAGLQDNHRALIVGSPPGRPRDPRAVGRESAGVFTAVPFGDQSWSIKMMTGVLERADGRSLARPPGAEGAVRLRGAPGQPSERDRDGGLRPNTVQFNSVSRLNP